MSTEERIYKQVEELSSSILKALESLENELSEYMNNTNKRLLFLEDKIKKMEAFIETSDKTVKVANNFKETSNLAPTKIIEAPIQKPQVPITKEKPPIPITPKVESPLQEDHKIPKEESIEKVAFKESAIPPIPKPPSFAVKKQDKNEDNLMVLPERKKPLEPKPNTPIAEKLEEKEKKETDKDKEELLTALKKIDSL